MSQKSKIILVSLLVIIILLISYVYYLSRPIHRVNLQLPSYFLYTSSSEEIPEEYLVPSQEVSITEPGGDTKYELIYQDDLLYQINGLFYCSSSNLSPEYIEYFSNSPGKFKTGGWSYRYALVCDNYYWILDGHDAKGINLYGRFSHNI